MYRVFHSGGVKAGQLTHTAREYLQKNHSAKTYKKKIGTADKRTDRQTDRQTETGDPFLRTLYSRGHERSKKCKSRESADGLHYNTSFTYAWEIKIMS